MTREIKFRGKDILTDKWVYGDLLHLGNAYAIVTSYEEETDQLSNSLNGFTSLMEKLSKKNEETQGKVNEAVGTIEGFVEGEEPMDLRRSPLRSIYNDFVCKCIENGLINFHGSSIPGGMVESYTRKNDREYLKVTLEHAVAPQPEKEKI